MPLFTAAAIPMNSQPDLAHNMDQAYRLISEAAGEGARFVGLPENFAFLGDEKKRLQQAGTISKTVEQNLAKWASEFEIFLMGGGYPVPAGNGKMYNRAVIIDPYGKTAAQYDKIHLFDVDLSDKESYRESELVEPGDKNLGFCRLIGPVRVGLSICYDIRFPELYRELAARGSRLLCIPAAFTKPTGEAHWEVLLRARAIENTCYVFAPAQTGRHGKKRQTYGHAMIVDPWGTVLADAGTEPGIAYARIDPELIREVRRKIPSLKHRVLYTERV